MTGRQRACRGAGFRTALCRAPGAAPGPRPPRSPLPPARPCATTCRAPAPAAPPHRRGRGRRRTGRPPDRADRAPGRPWPRGAAPAAAAASPSSRAGAAAPDAGGPVLLDVREGVAQMGREPEQRSGGNRPPPRPGRARQGERHRRGERAEPDRVRHPGEHRRLQPQVVEPGGGDRGEVHRTGENTAGQGERYAQDERDRRRGPHRADRDHAVGHRLPRRPARASRPASNASLHQPTESWPVSTATPTSASRAEERPAPTARAQASAVTATTGPGWQARARPAARPGHRTAVADVLAPSMASIGRS